MLLGKSALVTGSASTGGLGYAIVKTLAAAGCNVGLHGIMDPKELSQQCDSVKSEYEVNAAFSTADLTKPAEIRYLDQCNISMPARPCTSNLAAVSLTEDHPHEMMLFSLMSCVNQVTAQHVDSCCNIERPRNDDMKP